MIVREVVKLLKKDGWYLVDTKGSHMQFRHPYKQGKVTVPNHKGDVSLKTLKSIYKQAGLNK